METKRQLDVLDRHLAHNEWMAGDYSIADMAIWPWYGQMVLGRSYADSAEFLDVGIYANLKRWAEVMDARPGVKRGRIVNKSFGEEPHLPERHSAADFVGKV
jgi:GST-like protein